MNRRISHVPIELKTSDAVRVTQPDACQQDPEFAQIDDTGTTALGKPRQEALAQPEAGPGLYDKSNKSISLALRRIREAESLMTKYDLTATSDRIERESGTVREIIRRCIDFYYPAAAFKEVQLTEAAAPGTETIAAPDTFGMTQIISCLVNNAIKNIVSGSIEVRLSFSQSVGFFVVEVTDTGPGIPEAQLKLIFEELRLRSPRNGADTKKMGIGLSLSAELARKLGGKLVHRANPSGGAIFSAELRLQKPTLNETTPYHELQPPDTAHELGGGLRILFADDTEMFRNLLSGAQARLGYSVTTVRSGVDVIELFPVSEFDAIVMDLRMPGMDGITATRHIRSHSDKGKLIPIIAVTSQTSLETRKRCRNAGMNALIAKPFDPLVFKEGVERVVAARKISGGRALWINLNRMQ